MNLIQRLHSNICRRRKPSPKGCCGSLLSHQETAAVVALYHAALDVHEQAVTAGRPIGPLEVKLADAILRFRVEPAKRPRAIQKKMPAG